MSDRSGTDAPTSGRGSLLGGGLAMLVLAVVLSWLPVLGPLLAGGVGGWMIRDGRTAVLVALLPAAVLAVLLVGVLVAFELPVLGALAGAAVFVAVVVQEIPLLLGAYAGGMLRD